MGLLKTFNRFRAFFACFVISLLFGSSLGCKQPADRTRVSKSPIAVNVVTLTKVEDTVKMATYYGALEPNRSQTLGFTVSGKIQSIAKRGQELDADELMVDLDASEFIGKKASLESQLSQAQDQPQFQQLQQQIAGIDEQILTRRLLAPFDCVVDDVLAFENSLVRAHSPVLRIIGTSKPRIKISLPRRIADQIQSDLEVYFVMDDEFVIGKIVERSQVENAGSVFCWFDIESEISGGRYKFGQTVEARFNFQTGNSGYWVPMSALDRSGEGVWSVLLVNPEYKNVVSRKLVTIVQLAEDEALVDGDIPEGALVIANGIHRIVPGQEVDPRPMQDENESADGNAAK